MAALKFLVDLGVSKRLESHLRTGGYDLLCVRDIDPRLADEVILRRAAAEGRIVITMDKDFGELVYRSREPHAGVLLLRLDDADGTRKIQIVESILREHAADLPGHFSVYQNDRLRVRRRRQTP